MKCNSGGLSCLGIVDSQVKSVFPQDDALPWVLCKKSPELAAILDESDVLPLQDDPEVLVPPDIYMFKLMEGSSSISGTTDNYPLSSLAVDAMPAASRRVRPWKPCAGTCQWSLSKQPTAIPSPPEQHTRWYQLLRRRARPWEPHCRNLSVACSLLKPNAYLGTSDL